MATGPSWRWSPPHPLRCSSAHRRVASASVTVGRGAAAASTDHYDTSSRRCMSSSSSASAGDAPPSAEDVIAACHKLGLDPTSMDAAAAKKKYIELAKAHHPDVRGAGGAGPAAKGSPKPSVPSMAEINTAHGVLQSHFRSGGGNLNRSARGGGGAAGGFSWGGSGFGRGGSRPSPQASPPEFHQSFWEGFTESVPPYGQGSRGPREWNARHPRPPHAAHYQFVTPEVFAAMTEEGGGYFQGADDDEGGAAMGDFGDGGHDLPASMSLEEELAMRQYLHAAMAAAGGPHGMGAFDDPDAAWAEGPNEYVMDLGGQLHEFAEMVSPGGMQQQNRDRGGRRHGGPWQHPQQQHRRRHGGHHHESRPWSHGPRNGRPDGRGGHHTAGGDQHGNHSHHVNDTADPAAHDGRRHGHRPDDDDVNNSSRHRNHRPARGNHAGPDSTAPFTAEQRQAMRFLVEEGKSFDFISRALGRMPEQVIRAFNEDKRTSGGGRQAVPSKGGVGATAEGGRHKNSQKPPESPEDPHPGAQRQRQPPSIPQEVHYVELDDSGRPIRGTHRVEQNQRQSSASRNPAALRADAPSGGSPPTGAAAPGREGTSGGDESRCYAASDKPPQPRRDQRDYFGRDRRDPSAGNLRRGGGSPYDDDDGISFRPSRRYRDHVGRGNGAADYQDDDNPRPYSAWKGHRHRK